LHRFTLGNIAQNTANQRSFVTCRQVTVSLGNRDLPLAQYIANFKQRSPVLSEI
jgi:hypothetical protein